MSARFPLGQVVITPNAFATVPAQDVYTALSRHARGDWGDLDEHDREQNELSLQEGDRLLSVYYTTDGKKRKFWIITEHDRSVTTILMPEDY